MTSTRTGVALIAALLLAANALAQQDYDGRVVGAIEFRGLERASEQYVRSQLESKVGEPLQATAISRDLRRLYELGYFLRIDADANIVNGDLVLTYIFEEEKVIDDIQIFGNKKIKTRLILQELLWHEGDSFSESDWTLERDAILDFYTGKGFLNATVDVVVTETRPARVEVSYFITEGKKARIREIEFTGNDALSNRRLRKTIKTKPRRWLIIGGKYDQDKFENDLRLLLDEYGNVGRLEAAIRDTDFEFWDNGKKLKIMIDVSEGPVYHVATMETEDNYVYDDMELNRELEVRAGDVHNKGQVALDSEALRQLYSDSGYLNARVAPRVTLDRDRKLTTVVHDVNEGDLKYLRELKITGNSITRDEVVRRQFLIGPGDRFDGASIRRSQQRLERTRFFNIVRFNVEDVDDNDVFTDLLVDVEEGDTGNFNFGGGFSTDESIIGFAELTLDNFDITDWPTFSGAGQRFVARASIGDVRSSFNISFTDPELAGLPLSFGFDVFNETFRSRGGSDYDQTTRGGQIRFGKRLSETIDVTASFGYRNVDIDGIDQFVNPRFNELLDPDTTINTIWGVARDTTDDFRDPTRGMENSVRVALAGLGDNEYATLSTDSTIYRKITRDAKWVFSQRFRSDIGTAFGDREFIPLQDRFFTGGSTTIRGYETRDIGPKELDTSGELQAIGGEFRLIANTEFKYKVNEILRLYTFFDAGGTFLEPSDFDTGELRYSVGLGIGMEIPALGPVRIDYGFPLNPDGTQGSGELHLNTGFSF